MSQMTRISKASNTRRAHIITTSKAARSAGAAQPK